MSYNPIHIDTLFYFPAALTATGTTSPMLAADQDNAAPTNFGFQVTVASVSTNVVVRFEGSLDNTNFFALAASDTTITANGTTGYFFSGMPLKSIRGRLVTITGGTPSVTFVMSAR